MACSCVIADAVRLSYTVQEINLALSEDGAQRFRTLLNLHHLSNVLTVLSCGSQRLALGSYCTLCVDPGSVSTYVRSPFAWPQPSGYRSLGRLMALFL